MTLTRTLATALALGSGLGLSCYSERLPPPTYRYACDADADCLSNEVCRKGLCERPCTQITAEDDCPVEDGFVGLCFNGACVNTCDVGSDYCPGTQECLDLGLQVSSGGFGGGTSSVGVCALLCDAGDNADICPTGEVCIPEFGTCAVDCSAGQACPSGYVCFFGYCAPEGTELPGSDDGGSSGGQASTGGDMGSTGGDMSSTGAGDESGTEGSGSTSAAWPTDDQER